MYTVIYYMTRNFFLLEAVISGRRPSLIILSFWLWLSTFCRYVDSTDVISIHVGLADVLDSRQIGKELYIAIKENQLRGLIENQVFFAEMLDCLKYKFKRNGTDVIIVYRNCAE